MVKKENLTVNILHGFKLDKRRKQGLRNISSVYECKFTEKNAFIYHY